MILAALKMVAELVSAALRLVAKLETFSRMYSPLLRASRTMTVKPQLAEKRRVKWTNLRNTPKYSKIK
jgi:hypothetical protein